MRWKSVKARFSSVLRRRDSFSPLRSSLSPVILSAAKNLPLPYRSDGCRRFFAALRMTYSGLSSLLCVQRTDVADRLAQLSGAHDAAHDLTGTCLGQAGDELQFVGCSQRTDYVTNMLPQFLCQRVRRLDGILQNNKDLDTLALDLVGLADGRRLRYRRVADKGRFDLHRTQAVTANFDHVVNAPLDTEVAILVFRRSITSEVDAFYGLEVSFVAGRVAVDGAHQARPGMTDDQEATLIGTDRVAVLIHDGCIDGWQWPGRASRFERQHDRRTDHDSARLGLPPRVHNR